MCVQLARRSLAKFLPEPVLGAGDTINGGSCAAMVLIYASDLVIGERELGAISRTGGEIKNIRTLIAAEKCLS